MKELLNKFVLTCTAILICCIVVYGNVYAQGVYCGTIVDDCIPSSKRISGGYTSGNSWTTSPSYHRNILADFGSGNTCCEADRYDNNNQATYFSLSFVQDFYPLQKNASSFDTSDGAQTAFEPDSLSTSLKALPIYLITQSIIC